MLLRTVIICCTIVVNAEPPLNSYPFTGDSNGYDYSNTVTNNPYLRSNNKNSYQTDGNFYGTGDSNHKLSDHVSSSSLINNVGTQALSYSNVGNQGSIGSDIGNNYNGYAGYSGTYENSDSDSYSSSSRAATNALFNGYSNSNNNAESTFNAYSSSPIYKDSDFGQYTTSSSSSSSSKRVPAYSEYSKPAVENYSGDSVNSDVQGYPSSSTYSESDQVYSPYLPGGLTSEYSFGKQKDVPYNLKGNKYSDIYSIPSETRFTRGNVGHMSHNYDISPYISGSRPSTNSYFSKTHSSGIYSTGKPTNKYSYKYLSRYAPNSGVSYSTRERDGYYAPYGKGTRKIIIIKDNRPSYAGRIYSDESDYASSSGGYRSKTGAFINGYSTPPNFDVYSGSSSNYNDNPTASRRYRTSGNPTFVKRTISA
ncbi:uncharacterized protein [Anoplolepis gracilipes]|uniref:uncharacterized protein n=1 Tax=Anoplolepis gracilipes TaxID=354296 RepID=UPI003B9FF873